ncbi:MAG: hypothetical protein DMG93_13260 [Acidobacteria bacterium]|nr:MAG: hypothetical protein DMG93_13260 [Acidobacteriota bacterium]
MQIQARRPALHNPSPPDYNFVERVMLPGMSISVKGTTGLIIAAAIIVAVLIAFPAYRVFFAISVGIGVIVAGILYLRNKYRPITDKDVDNKRPLGLS